MRRFARHTIPVTIALVMAVSASAATARTPPANCVPPHAHVLLANRLAVVYTVTERVVETLEGPHGPTHFVNPTLVVRGCVDGHRRSYAIGEPVECSAGSTSGCGGIDRETLTGTTVAYEEMSVSSEGNGGGSSSYIVVVRDLRTGRILHRTPTGTPLRPRSGYVGVGKAVAIVVKGDGSVAWIAEDYERSSGARGVVSYFDVEAVDKTGARLLAAGTTVDPSSLSLSLGATNVGPQSATLLGSTLYWTQDGKPVSAVLR
jgi:hypothetical protein